MTYRSATLCATQAQHYRDASATFERHRTTSASHIFGLHKSPNIQAKRRVAWFPNRAKSENLHRIMSIYTTWKCATLTSRDVARMSRLPRDNVALASHITSRFGTSFPPHSNKIYFIKVSWSFAHVIENQCTWAHFIGLEAFYFAIINKYIKKTHVCMLLMF